MYFLFQYIVPKCTVISRHNVPDSRCGVVEKNESLCIDAWFFCQRDIQYSQNQFDRRTEFMKGASNTNQPQEFLNIPLLLLPVSLGGCLDMKETANVNEKIC